ncbi:MAG TPA: DUF1634 domain-containing protein [Candidatus Bathyarchaeia archaeon]|nr:DUF1634 domain-containing protein [Candidatus Bathyarchaeia archaeon]
MSEAEKDFNRTIGLVLRVGVTIAFAVIAIGSGLLFVEGQSGYGSPGSAEQLYNNRFVLGLAPLFQGVFAAKPFAIIDFGLILLFATPLARVFISIFLFFEEKRYIFVWITIVVLSILLLSTFVIGPLLSSGT